MTAGQKKRNQSKKSSYSLWPHVGVSKCKRNKTYKLNSIFIFILLQRCLLVIWHYWTVNVQSERSLHTHCTPIYSYWNSMQLKRTAVWIEWNISYRKATYTVISISCIVFIKKHCHTQIHSARTETNLFSVKTKLFSENTPICGIIKYSESVSHSEIVNSMFKH